MPIIVNEAALELAQTTSSTIAEPSFGIIIAFNAAKVRQHEAAGAGAGSIGPCGRRMPHPPALTAI